MAVDMILLRISYNDDVNEVPAIFALFDQIRYNKTCNNKIKLDRREEKTLD